MELAKKKIIRGRSEGAILRTEAPGAAFFDNTFTKILAITTYLQVL